MPCYFPLNAWYGEVQESGKRKIVFKRKDADPVRVISPLKLPCGQCHGCRLERSRQWALRIMHEAKLHDHNSFITLTFDREHLPEDGSLSVRTFQLFMKKLRKEFWEERKPGPRIKNLVGDGIRFFHCGEYGERYRRPHYHACLLGVDFADKRPFTVRQGNTIYTSETLSRLWGNGYASIGDVTFESAAYVARYVMKKVTGKKKNEPEGELGLKPYERVIEGTGEVVEVHPEYTTMSRRPGIGAEWYRKFKLDVYPNDYVIVRGHKARPPRFYDGLYEAEDPDGYRSLKSKRVARATVKVPVFNEVLGKVQMLDDNRDERLVVKEVVAKSRLVQLKRSLED